MLVTKEALSKEDREGSERKCGGGLREVEEGVKKVEEVEERWR